MANSVSQRKGIAAELLVLLIIMCSIMQGISDEAGRYLLYAKAFTGGLLWVILILFYKISIYHLLFVFLAGVWGFVCAFLGDALTIKENLVILITYAPAGLLIFTEERLHVLLWEIAYVFLTVFLLGMYFSNPVPELVFYQTSRNYISIYLLLLLFVLTVACEKAKRQIPLWYGILVFVCGILCVGRAGILASGLYLLGLILIKYRGAHNIIQKEWLRYTCIAGLGIIVLVMIVYSDYIAIRFFSRFVDAASAGSDSQRIAIYKSYLQAITGREGVKALLFGKNPMNLSKLISSLNGNLHSSYLMLHSRYGLVGLISFIAAYMITCIKAFKEQQKYFLLIVCIFALRAVTDYAFPYLVGDIFCWYLFFAMMGQKETRKKGVFVRW